MGVKAYDDALVNNATGVQVTSGAASANVAVPNDSSGSKARFVRIMAKANVYVRPVAAGSGTATVNDMLVSPNEALILNVAGLGFIAYIQETAATIVNISPLE